MSTDYPGSKTPVAGRVRFGGSLAPYEAYRSPNKFPEHKWDAERKETLTRLWNEGRSAGYIADLLGGTTRNAVIGKAHRLGLPGRAQPTRMLNTERKARKTKQSTPAPKTPRVYVPRPWHTGDVEGLATASQRAKESHPTAKHKTLLDLDPNDCRWPFGDGPFTFCGCKKSPIGSYCEEHTRLATAPPMIRPRPAMFTRAAATNVGPEDLPESLVKAA